MTSIKVRLLLGVTCGMAILLMAFAMVVYGFIYQSLMDSFDSVLLSTARTIHGFVEQNQAEIKIEVDETQVPEFSRASQPDYFQMWRDGGTTLARSPSIRGGELERFEGPLDVPVFRSLRLPDGRAGRAVSLRFAPKIDEEIKDAISPQKVILVVARETVALDAGIRRLGWLLAIATFGTILLALFVGTLVVRQGLRPLDELAAHIASIRHDDLAAQVPAARMPAEMVPVVGRLNDLLHRLEEAFRRERAFAADAAHELRTPLSGLRCTLEVALTRPRTDKEYRLAMAECLEIIGRMQQMVDDLLVLARMEDGQNATRLERVRLGELIDATWLTSAGKASARGISMESVVPTDLACTADLDTLAMIFTNLFENAAEYANNGGHIQVRAGRKNQSVEISVANTGCQLTHEDTRHVFDRFWRGDAARTNTGIHCGLGLALVQRATAGLGGTVSAEVIDGTFTIRLTLPSAC